MRTAGLLGRGVISQMRSSFSCLKPHFSWRKVTSHMRDKKPATEQWTDTTKMRQTLRMPTKAVEQQTQSQPARISCHKDASKRLWPRQQASKTSCITR
eukprot:1137870-Pelagomonas_calceolata.AAC.2